MSKKNKMLGLYGIALAAMMSDPMGVSLIGPEKDNELTFPLETDPNKQALNIPCPTGLKTYFFNSSGEFETGKMKRDECVYVCHALNDKNAVRKFKKNWKP